MTEAKCAATHDGILDALDTVGFTGVNCHRKHLAGKVFESCLVAVGHEALFWPSDVETNHSVVAVAHGQLGNLKASVEVTHGGHELPGANAVALLGSGVCAVLEPILHGCDNLVEGEALAKVLLWRPANFAIDDAVGSQIEHKLFGNAL